MGGPSSLARYIHHSHEIDPQNGFAGSAGHSNAAYLTMLIFDVSPNSPVRLRKAGDGRFVRR
jgi:hypothetical protein